MLHVDIVKNEWLAGLCSDPWSRERPAERSMPLRAGSSSSGCTSSSTVTNLFATAPHDEGDCPYHRTLAVAIRSEGAEQAVWS